MKFINIAALALSSAATVSALTSVEISKASAAALRLSEVTFSSASGTVAPLQVKANSQSQAHPATLATDGNEATFYEADSAHDALNQFVTFVIPDDTTSVKISGPADTPLEGLRVIYNNDHGMHVQYLGADKGASTITFPKISAQPAESRPALEKRQLSATTITQANAITVGNPILSPNKRVSLGITGSQGFFVLAYQNAPVHVIADPTGTEITGATSVDVLANGRLKVNTSSGVKYVGIEMTALDTYTVDVTDDFIVRTVSPSRTVNVRNQSSNAAAWSDWGYEAVMNRVCDGQPMGYGNDVNVYLLDSGVGNALDISRQLMPGTSRRWADLSTYSDANVYSDNKNHGTLLATIIKGRWCGIAQSANLYNVKVTIDNTRGFYELDFIRAIKSVVNHAVTGPKVINLSSAWRWPSSSAKCAIQYAYYANVMIVHAAGNENDILNDNIPYKFTIGAVDQDGSVSSYSEYGPTLHAWAPGRFVNKQGTSIATAFATGVLVTALTKYPTLQTTPGYAFKYIYDRARTDIVSTTDPKVVASTLAGNRFVSTKNFATAPASPPASWPVSGAKDQCANLASIVGRYFPSQNPSAADWTALESYVSSTVKINLVDATESGFINRDWS